MNPKNFILIGPGNIGLSIASLLQDRDYTCAQVVSRTDDSHEIISKWLGEDTQINLWGDWQPVQASLVLVAIPDDTLADMALNLTSIYSAQVHHDITFVHFSGIKSSGVFTPLKDMGLKTCSLHPLQTVPDIEMGRKALLECTWAYEGDSGEICREIVEHLNGEMIQLTEEQKIPYHLSAVLASNLLVALEAMAIDIASEAGISQKQFLKMFGPLIKQSLDNLLRNGPNRAISGPLKRADNDTIDTHLEWLQSADERYLSVYRELSHYLMEVLLAEDIISLQQVEDLTKTLDETS